MFVQVIYSFVQRLRLCMFFFIPYCREATADARGSTAANIRAGGLECVEVLNHKADNKPMTLALTVTE